MIKLPIVTLPLKGVAKGYWKSFETTKGKTCNALRNLDNLNTARLEREEKRKRKMRFY